jgi:DNA invertase Pin-like site-specific DNA recombinase
MYAASHNLDLDDALTFQDLGVSAYHGTNAETGRLGDFLEAVKAGDILSGSYLLVESLDRISRTTPRKAVRILEDICEAGITLVTLTDQRVYTEASLDGDHMAMLYALIVAQRANEESATKAKRLKQAWVGKRLTAATKPLTAICPGWLRLSDDRARYEVIEERAAVVRSIFDMSLSGLGQNSIASSLNDLNTPTFGRAEAWQRSYVKKLLENPAVLGRFTPHTLDTIARRKVRTALQEYEGYYPAIVDVERFEKVSMMISGRSPTQPKGKAGPSPMANILSGLAKCPACGATMTRVNKGGRGGKPYLVCTKAKVGAGCDYRQVKLELVESAIVSMGTYLHGVTPSPNADYEERYRASLINSEAVEEEIQNLVATLARGTPSKAVLNAIAKREALLDTMRIEVTELAELAAASMTNRVDNAVDEFRKLTTVDGDALDVARINATMRQLFDKVVVDYEVGYLRLHWRHTDHSPAEVLYAFV